MADWTCRQSQIRQWCAVLGGAVVVLFVCGLPFGCSPGAMPKLATTEDTASATTNGADRDIVSARMEAALQRFPPISLPMVLSEDVLWNDSHFEEEPIDSVLAEAVSCSGKDNILAGVCRSYPLGIVRLASGGYFVLILSSCGIGGRYSDICGATLDSTFMVRSVATIARVHADCGFANIQTATVDSDLKVTAEHIERSYDCDGGGKVVSETRKSVVFSISDE